MTDVSFDEGWFDDDLDVVADQIQQENEARAKDDSGRCGVCYHTLPGHSDNCVAWLKKR